MNPRLGHIWWVICLLVVVTVFAGCGPAAAPAVSPTQAPPPPTSAPAPAPTVAAAPAANKARQPYVQYVDEQFDDPKVERGKVGTFEQLPAGLPKPNKRYKIAWFVDSLTQDYMVDVQKGMKEMADKLGVDLQTFDANLDANRVMSDLDTVIANNYDGVMGYAVDPALGPRISKKLNDAGMAALWIDTPLTAFDYYQAVPNPVIGYQSGKALVDAMKAKNWDPEKTVWICGDISAFAACTMRCEGYKKALDEAYPNFPKNNIVWYDMPYTLEDAMKSVNDTITAHPADNYVVTGVCADQVAEGAARALQAAGFTADHAMVSGQGGGKGPRDELRKPKSLYASYGGYMPICAGKLAVNYMVRILNREPNLPKNVGQKVVVLTKDTVDKYYPNDVEVCSDEDMRGMADH